MIMEVLKIISRLEKNKTKQKNIFRAGLKK